MSSNAQKPHSVSFAVQELLRKHAAGELEMASGPRCMTSAEQSEVLDTLIGTLEQLEAALRAVDAARIILTLADEERDELAGEVSKYLGPWADLVEAVHAVPYPASRQEEA